MKIKKGKQLPKGAQPVLYTFSSVLSWAVDTAGFYLLNLLLRPFLGGYTEPVCNVLARVVSSLFNFHVNYKVVFGSTQSYGQAMLRYYFLAVPQLAVSTVLVTLFCRLLKVDAASGATAVKIVVDGCLFVASFFIQKYWVFRKKESKPGTRAEE
jgi:putative flippase GtrA